MTTTTLRFAILTLGLAASSMASAELKIAGSDTLEPYFQNALSQYARGLGAGVQVKADYKGTTQGFRELCEGRATIVPASSKLEGDALARCQQSHRVHRITHRLRCRGGDRAPVTCEHGRD